MQFSHFLKNNDVDAFTKAKLMKEISIRDFPRAVENLQDNLLTYYRLCSECNSLHSVNYCKYEDLFCNNCGNPLCVDDHNELGLYDEEQEIEEEEVKNFIDKIQCAYCECNNK
jgi:hypothetical protein